MKFFICGCLAASLLLAFAIWLGWGSRAKWQHVSGWTKLSDPEISFLNRSLVQFQQEENHPELLWFGHATISVEWGEQRFLCDPVAASRIKVAPRLFDTPILKLDKPCDVILLTHAHMDHMDNSTLERLPPTRICLPTGSERFLSQKVLSRHEILPMHLGEKRQFGKVEIASVPARHGGWRYPWQRGLFACGYIIKHAGESLYIAGDTATGEHFASIKKAHHPRYAVLPIGAYSPEWFLRIRHLNPEEALEAAEQVGADYIMPYHFGTYRLSAEPMDEPLRRFATTALFHGQKWILPVLEVLE